MGVASSFSDEIREAVRGCGLTPYFIGKNAKVSNASLSTFLAGKAGMELAAVDRIASLIGLHVRTDGAAKALAKSAPRRGRPKQKE